MKKLQLSGGVWSATPTPLNAAGHVVIDQLHVPFDAKRGEVLVACQRHFRVFQEMHAGDPVFRVFASEGSTRRLLSSYTIKHVWP